MPCGENGGMARSILARCSAADWAVNWVGAAEKRSETLKDAMLRMLAANMNSTSYLIRLLIGFAILTVMAYFVIMGWSSR